MRRITVSLDDSLVELAESDVAAGRAPSVSAWVAGAIRAKARARAELVDDLLELERSDPTPSQMAGVIARSIGVSKQVVLAALKRPRQRSRQKRAG